MTISFTRSASDTFSLANAHYISSKVAADLRQLQRYYGAPGDTAIDEFAQEAAILAYHGYVEKVIYGFLRGSNWVLTLEYTAVNGTLTADDRAGGVHRRADITGTVFHSLLFPTLKWWDLTAADRAEINGQLPFTREAGTAPGYTGGRHVYDRTYSANGTGFTRGSYQPL